jgi:Tol biopolymer transport system component
MSLAVGTRLGSYEILGTVGAGGMGEVYRARDTRLDREVAVKVLPTHLAMDADSLARFEREAKAVAALSHPNILAIHDFGRTDNGTVYAVMELLDGETVRQRLADGPVPPKKVMQIGADVANGLAAAHARGIVHRDLKPENLFITNDGRVKILDFGLAGPLEQPESANSPTAMRHTDPGTVLGTVGYMSPEQVKGQAADHRSDVFSLGCVLGELATGRRVFERETAAETMTAILREDAELSPAGAALPPGLETVIRHCLEKRPEERFQSARDLAFALQSLSGATMAGGSTPKSDVQVPVAASRSSRAPLMIGTAVLVVAVASYFAGRAAGPGGAAAAPSVSFQQLTDDAGLESEPALSPDGQSFAFASARRGSSDIFVQRVGGRNPVVVAGDPNRDEAAPAFSPDGAWIAFHDAAGSGGIFVTGATGESTRRLTDFGYHPAWSPDGQRIVFCTELISVPQSRGSNSALWTVDVKGGAPVKLSEGDAVQPSWSPGNKQIAYWAVDTGQRDIFTMPVTGGPRVAITSDAPIDWAPVWSADGRYLYFSSDRGGSMNIWRVPMDESSGKATGPPEPVTAGVAAIEQSSLSHDGRKLIFRASESSVNPAAIPFDPVAEKLGAAKAVLDRSGSMVPTGISPDGHSLVLWNIGEHQEDVFIVRTDGTELRRLTDDAFRDRWGVFSPDGSEVAFYSNRTNSYNIFTVKTDGSGLHAITAGVGNTQNLLYPTYSPTGDRLIASRARTPESLIFDPRLAATAQKPISIDTSLPDKSWVIPMSWSPDGRRICGWVTNSAGSSVGFGYLDVESKTVRQVTGVFGVSAQAWLKDSRRMILLDQVKGRLVLLEVDTGRQKELATGLDLSVNVVLSPDDRTLYVAIARKQADIWMATLGGSR